MNALIQRSKTAGDASYAFKKTDYLALFRSEVRAVIDRGFRASSLQQRMAG